MKTNIRILTLLIFLATACKKKEPPPPGIQTKIVEGIITDSSSNAPLAHVSIMLNKHYFMDFYHITVGTFFSDTLGRFYYSFEADLEYSYELQFEKLNYRYCGLYDVIFLEENLPFQYLSVKMAKDK